MRGLRRPGKLVAHMPKYEVLLSADTRVQATVLIVADDEEGAIQQALDMRHDLEWEEADARDLHRADVGWCEQVDKHKPDPV